MKFLRECNGRFLFQISGILIGLVSDEHVLLVNSICEC